MVRLCCKIDSLLSCGNQAGRLLVRDRQGMDEGRAVLRHCMRSRQTLDVLQGWGDGWNSEDEVQTTTRQNLLPA